MEGTPISWFTPQMPAKVLVGLKPGAQELNYRQPYMAGIHTWAISRKLELWVDSGVKHSMWNVNLFIEINCKAKC